MKKYFYFFFVAFLFCIFTSIQIYAQSSSSHGIKHYRNCKGLVKAIINAGDTLICHCDSLQLLNPNAWRSMQSAYGNLYNTSNELITKTDSSVLIYKSRFETLSGSYNQLKVEYDHFIDKTKSHIDSTDNRLRLVNQSLANADQHLTKTDSLILNSVKDIKKAETQKWKDRFKAAGVGITVGVLLTIFLQQYKVH
jgi:hypothetical protein